MLLGNPFIIQNHDKVTIAKYIGYDSHDGR